MFRGSIVALVTPMGESGEVDFGTFEALLDWHAEQGTDGVVVAGTTGEAATLLASEVEELLRRAVRRLGGRVPVIAGTGMPSTAITIERTRTACEVGVDGVLMVTPYYNRPGQAGLLQHFWAAAEASSVPVLLYNVPSRTACDLLPETLEQLAEHPRIVGIKDATGDIARARAILERCGDDFLLFSGDDATCASGCCAQWRAVANGAAPDARAHLRSTDRRRRRSSTACCLHARVRRIRPDPGKMGLELGLIPAPPPADAARPRGPAGGAAGDGARIT
jgi:4-hydroxy-tetrahydrodipicolinate synthase